MKSDTDIISVFESATEADLEKVRSRREALEKQLAGLEAVEKTLTVLLHGKPERKKAERKSTVRPIHVNGEENGSSMQQKRRKVVDYIAANGPKSQQKLSEVTGIGRVGPGCLSRVIDCDLFHASPDGIVSLTDAGDRMARVP